MGRRKIEIRPIAHERNRAVTFQKQETEAFAEKEWTVQEGLRAISALFDRNSEERPGQSTKCYEYSSGDVKNIVNRHIRWDGERDTKGTADYAGGAIGGRSSAGDDDDDEDDGMEETSRKRHHPMSMGSMNHSSDYSHHSRGMTLPQPPPPGPLHPAHPFNQLSHNPSKKPRMGSGDTYSSYSQQNYRGSGYGSTQSYYPPGQSPSGYTSPPTSYDFPHTRPSRSASVSNLQSRTGQDSGYEFRQISGPTSGGASGYSGPFDSSDHGNRHAGQSGADYGTQHMDWSGSGPTTNSPSTAAATIPGTGTGGQGSLGSGGSSGNPANPDSGWLNFLSGDGSSNNSQSGMRPGGPRSEHESAGPDLFHERPSSSRGVASISRARADTAHSRTASTGSGSNHHLDGDIKREPV